MNEKIEPMTDNYKIIPKLCTTISFSTTSYGQIILNLTYSDNSESQTYLIERILLDKEHAKMVAEKLNEVVEGME